MSTQRHRSARLITVVAVLAAATAATASDVQYECTTNGAGNWSVVASAPLSTECPDLPVRECTEIQYSITPLLSRAADHVAVLVDHELTVIPPQASYLSLACDGDSVTGIGIRDCSTQAVRMNKDATTQTYNLFVEGAAAPTGKSIVVKKGSIVEECGIVSLAPSTCNPKAQLATKQTYQFEDCIIEIELDPCTGEPGTPNVISGSCEVDSAPVGTLTISVNGSDPEVVTIGEGWVSFGENSCTTTLISGLSVTTCTCTSNTDCTKKKSNGTYYCPESKYSICAPYQ